MSDESHRIQLIIDAQDNAKSVLSRVRGDLRAWAADAVRYAKQVAIAIGALTGVLTLLANRGARVQSVATIFDETARRLGRSSSELLAHLQRVTRGTVSNFQLMAQANAALGSGAITLDDFSTALEFVGLKAKATGEDVDTLTSKIITGLLRGSVQLLDDALPALTQQLDRLNMSGLSEAQKKAVTLQLAFRMMREELGTLRKTAGDVRDRFEQAKTTFTNLRDRLALIVAQSPAVKQVFTELSVRLDQVTQWVERNQNAIEAWLRTGIGYLRVVVQLALRTAEWAVAHAGLLAKLAMVGVLITFVAWVGRGVLAVTQLITAMRALGTISAITLGAGGIAIAIAGLAALAIGAFKVRDAFRQARLAMEGMTIPGLQKMQATVVDRTKVHQLTATGGFVTRTVQELRGGREIINAARALMPSFGAAEQTMLDAIIGDAEKTQDLQRKAELLNILRDRLIALLRVRDEMVKGSGIGADTPGDMPTIPGLDIEGLQAMIDQMSAGAKEALTPVEQLQNRLDLLNAHFALGEENGVGYLEGLREIAAAAKRLATEQGATDETIIAAAGIYDDANKRLQDYIALLNEAADATNGLREETNALAEGISQAVGEAIVQSIRTMADTVALLVGSIFETVQGADHPLKRLLAAVLNTFGDMLIGAGIMALGIGKVVEGVKAAIASMTGAPAVAVGIAAIAAGALLKGAAAALMASVQKGAQGGGAAGATPFRVDLGQQQREQNVLVNVYVTDELGERRVQRLQKKISSNEKRDISIRVPLGT